MWRPRTINLDVDGHAYVLARAKTGWSEVGKPLPPGLWAEVDRPVKRAVFWWRVRVLLFGLACLLFCLSIALRATRPKLPSGALTTAAPASSWNLQALQVLPALAYGTAIFFMSRAPLAVKHSAPKVSHEPQCRSCKYSLAGLEPNDVKLLVCPECGTKN